MRIFAYVEEAIASLFRNRLRSILTMLAMIIGSATIVMVFGISRATTSGTAALFKSFGESPVIVSVDKSQNDPSSAQIHYRDVDSVRVSLGNQAAQVLPIWQREYQVTLGTAKDYVTVTDDGSYHTDELVMAEGRKISSEDVASDAHVVVVTQDLVKQFLGDQPAVGKFLRINGDRYEIIGVYADIKGSFFNSLGGGPTAVVPYTTFHGYLDSGPPDMLAVYPSNTLAGDTVGKATVTALQRIHGEKAKYQIQNTAELLNTIETTLNVIGIGLSVISSVALVVAGIGIMNIMLVSVAERTREIGIRKSVGASRKDIVLQFLMESVVLSIAGGGIGLLVGLGATFGASALLTSLLGSLLVPYGLIVTMALLFSFLVGTIFGTYPALRAAALDPIEALRT